MPSAETQTSPARSHLLRIASILIAALGLLLAGWSVREILGADTRALFIAQVSAAFQTPLDPHDWANHWRTTFVQIGVLGCLLVLAAVGLWQRKPAAALFLAILLAADLLLDLLLHATGYVRYAFEMLDPVLALIELLFIAAALFTWRRLRRTAQPSE